MDTDMAHQVTDWANKPDLQDYIQQKFPRFTDATYLMICFFCHGKALKRLEETTRTRIHKFIFDWLPTGKHMRRIDPTYNDACPSCLQPHEDQFHVLTCEHPNREDQRDEHFTALDNAVKKLRIPAAVWALLKEGIRKWLLDPHAAIVNRPAQWPQLPHRFYKNHLEQTRLFYNVVGWEQLLYCRVPRNIVEATSVAMEGPDFTAADRATAYTQQTPKLIVAIWHFIEACWLDRNKDLHGRDDAHAEQLKRHRFQDRIRAAYELMPLLRPSDRAILSRPLDERLDDHLTTQEAWLNQAEPALAIAVQADLEEQPPITVFFEPNPPD
jgi:hypothetical protein